MKKALAILMALVVIAGAAFADTFGNESTVKVEGNAKVIWGVSLDEPMYNGFKNEQSFKISIPLLTKQTYSHQSEGENYAVIDIKDVQYNLVADNDPFASGDKKVDNVTAKLVFGDFYVVIEDKPGFKTNNAEIWAPIKNDGYFDSPKEGNKLRFEPGFDVIGGIKAGYKAEKFDVAAKLGSQTDYNGTSAPDRKSRYAFGFDVSADPSAMISAAATFNYAMYPRKTKATDDEKVAEGIISTGAKVVAKPVDGLELKLALDAGNDYVTTKDAKLVDVFAFDALASAKYKFIEAGFYYGTLATPYSNGELDLTDPLNPVMVILPSVDSEGNRTADAAVFLKLTDGDFVENLDGWITVMADRLMSSPKVMNDADPEMKATFPTLAIGTGLNYKYALNDVNYIKPYFELYAQNMSALAEKGTDFVHAGLVGAEYGLFTNTTLTAQYEAGLTQKNKRFELIDVAAKSTKGLFTLACKVTY